MRPMRRRRLVWGVVLAVCVLAPAAFAGGGNSSSAKQCQKDGWQTAQTDTGSNFTSNDACTAYAAGGGVLFSPTVVPSFVVCLGSDPSYAFYFFTASGFHPNSTVAFQRGSDAFPLFTLTTDANGAAASPSYLVGAPSGGTAISAGAVGYALGPADMTVTDAHGVHGTVTFTATCSA
jgi:hypothetical protein